MQELWKSPSANVSNPLFNYLQKLGISSSRNLQANSSSMTPVPSLLTPGLASEDGKAETDGTKTKQKDVSKPKTVRAVAKKIKQSPRKVNLVVALIRGMRVEDALLQLQLTVKRASKAVYQVIHSARANATHNHGLDPDRLIVAEAFTGKGLYTKEVRYHAKGRSGIMKHPECRVTVIVREITAEEEAKIARLRVHNLHKLTKRERALVPHKLIETNPVWERRGKRNNQHA